MEAKGSGLVVALLLVIIALGGLFSSLNDRFHFTLIENRFWQGFLEKPIPVSEKSGTRVYHSIVIGASDISFVASDEELDALAVRTDLRGIAVSLAFYKATTSSRRAQIVSLIQHLVALRSRPIYLYGQPFDRDLAAWLLVDEKTGYKEKGEGCTPTAWAAIYPGVKLDGTNSTTKMCGADDDPRNEEKFRSWISAEWKDTVSFLKKGGYKLAD